MATKVSNYLCPSCTGPLRFSSETGRLECEYCGSSFTVEEVDASSAGREQAAAVAFQTEESKKRQQPAAPAPAPAPGAGATEDWSAGMREYTCPSCGSHMVCDENTAVVCCPYCGNQGVVPGQFSGMDKPDYVIPFKLDKAAAIAKLQEHYKGKPFLPKAFKEGNQVQKLQGVYIPFWLFDATVEAQCQFDGRIVYERENKRDEVQHFDSRRSGSASFARVPVDASRRMEDDLMDSILPYQYKDLKRFSMAYFAGYLAERYDVGEDECAQRAEDQCIETTVNVLAQDARKKGRYTEIEVESVQSTFRRDGRSYVMLPVWLLSTQWQGENFLFAMNGQTGKMVGDLPVSMPKWWASLLGLSALFSVLWTIVMIITSL